MKRQSSIILSLATFVALILGGCATPKNVTYMQNFNQGDVQPVKNENRIRVQPDDRLAIYVSAKDLLLAESFNLVIAQRRLGYGYMSSDGRGDVSRSGEQGSSVYTVDPEGNIDFPILGRLHVAGQTRAEVASMVRNRILDQRLLADPIVVVDITNASFSVLGDVKNPGDFNITSDDLNIWQALAKAGDANVTGVMDNVLVVRRENNADVAYRLNLCDAKQTMESPAYWIKQGDVIYVEPNNVKKRQATPEGNSFLTPSFWISVASLLTTITAIIIR